MVLAGPVAGKGFTLLWFLGVCLAVLHVSITVLMAGIV